MRKPGLEAGRSATSSGPAWRTLPSTHPVLPQLGELLSGALQRLVEDTRVSRAAAWAPEPGARPILMAVQGDPSFDPPGADVLEALFRLPGATDLGTPGLDATLAEFSRKAGFAAAVPLGGAAPIAGIFLGEGVDDRAGLVRPRTLAALEGLVDRLHAPAATAAAIGRLASQEEELLRMTRLATLGDLVAEAVHEIRNPLVSVKTFLQLLPDNLDDPDFHTNFRGAVIDEVRRMERLLDTILQQARPGAPASPDQPEAALGTTLEAVVRLLEKRAMEKHLRLVVDVGPDLPLAAIDEDALRQIVLNLSLNAFEVTPSRGSVVLTASRGILEGRDALELLVDDQGPGVPEAERTRLFEPFFSTRAERPGGLGLTVCRRLVAHARGTIQVEDAPGERGGARFRVRLPAAAGAGPATTSAGTS